MYKIQNRLTGEWLLYSDLYDAVVWIDPERLHKHYEGSFLFTFEQLDDLMSNLLENIGVVIFCLDEG